MRSAVEGAGSEDRFRHFVQAQDGVYAQAKAELARGEKQSHWMWFIFPQIAGLGRSAMAERYALASLDEAVVYLQHALLGARLHEITTVVKGVPGRSVAQIFGYPDDLKFHSSMTLFALATERTGQPDPVYRGALTTFFSGRPDDGTLKLLRTEDGR